MIACPGCGGNIRFEIASQKMKCEYCGKSYSPDDQLINTQSGTAKDEDGLLEVTVFTCPQCGAEMYSEDASATAFCSYCGAANVLEQRLEGIKRPTHIVPFAKTEEECRALIKKEIKGFPFAPEAFRNGAILDRLRPVYLPYWNLETREDGQITGTGVKKYSENDIDITETYDISVTSKSRYSDILFDASAVFDDTLAAEIAPFPLKERKAFKPAYLSGFYAETANVDASVYAEDAGRIADCREDEELSRQFGMDVKVEKRPEHTFSEGSMMFPVWFTSLRQGKRICYALVNGYNGKVYCDMPIDIAKYLFATLLLALPIFALSNILFTFKPIVTLFIAAFVGCIISIAAACVTNSVRKRNRHTDDKGYRSLTGSLPTEEDYARDAVDTRTPEQIAEAEKAEAEKEEKKKKKAEAAEKQRNADAADRQKKEAAEKQKEEKGGVISAVLGFFFFILEVIIACIMASASFAGLGFLIIFVLVIWFLLCENLQIILYAAGVLGLLISVGINSYQLDLSGHQAASGLFGETGVSRKGGELHFHFPGVGSVLINAAIIAGGVIVGRHYAEDAYYYFGTTLILAASLIGIISVVLQHNELSTRPLPFLKTEDERKTEQHNLTEIPKHFLIFFICTLLSMTFLSAAAASEVRANAPAAADYQHSERGYEYQNPETGCSSVVYDDADLLSDEEERALADEIEHLTEYGNIGFISGDDPSMTDYKEYRESVYRNVFGKDNGTVFFIDMTNRKVNIFSDGANYKVITNSYADTITDNVYQYATDGSYYECASEAFAEIGKLLDGKRITQPMKYINNFLISLILSGLIVWFTILILTGSKARSKKEIVADIQASFRFTDQKETLLDIRKHTKSSGSGDGGSSSGGGSSGGGGSHSF